MIDGDMRNKPYCYCKEGIFNTKNWKDICKRCGYFNDCKRFLEPANLRCGANTGNIKMVYVDDKGKIKFKGDKD